MQIRVPAVATSLRLDQNALGLALQLYLNVDIGPQTKTWELQHELADIPTDASNLIIKTVLAINDQLTPHQLKIESQIPINKGFHTQTMAVLAGIELANQLGKMNLTREMKLQLAAKLDGQVNIAAAALYGNLVVGAFNDEDWAQVVPIKMAPFDIACFVPDGYQPLTQEQIEVNHLSIKDPIYYSMMVAAIATQNSKLIHQLTLRNPEPKVPAELSPFEAVKDKVLDGPYVYATSILGNGPAIMVATNPTYTRDTLKELQTVDVSGDWYVVSPDRTGMQVK